MLYYHLVCIEFLLFPKQLYISCAYTKYTIASAGFKILTRLPPTSLLNLQPTDRYQGNPDHGEVLSGYLWFTQNYTEFYICSFSIFHSQYMCTVINYAHFSKISDEIRLITFYAAVIG